MLLALAVGGCDPVGERRPDIGRSHALAADTRELYDRTRDQAGHEFVKTGDFLVPVGARIAIKGLEFEPGVATLTATQRAILQQVFNSIEEITENTIGDTNRPRVEEFSRMAFAIRVDAQGAIAAPENLALAQARANAALNVLTNLGTPAWRLQATEAGLRTPVKSEAPPAEPRRNDRIEFIRTR